MDREIILKLPLCSNNLLCARLTTSAVCSLLNLNLDDSEDLKVCVNEACLLIMGQNYKVVRLVYNLGDTLTIGVYGEGVCDNPPKSIGEEERELCVQLLNSLVDKVEYNKVGGIIESIMLVKRIN